MNGLLSALADRPLLDVPSGVDASVDNPYSGILADELLQKTYLQIAEPWDAYSGARRMICISSDGYASDVDGALPDDGTPLPHQLFRARLAAGQVFNVESSVMDGGSFTEGPPSFGATAVIIADNDLEIMGHLLLDWRNALVRTYLGRRDLPLAAFQLIGKRHVVGIDSDTMVYRISTADLALPLRKDVQTRFYRGMGNCLRFNGTTAYASGTLACPAGSMMIELWIRPTASATTVRRMAGWRNGSAAGERMLGFDSGATNRAVFEVRNDAGTLFALQAASLPGSLGLEVGTFYHVAGVLDIAALVIRLLIYDDSDMLVYSGSQAVTGTFATVLNTFYLARNESGSEFLPAELDEIRIWSIARDDTAIGERRSKEIATDTTGLYAYYKCNEGTGAAVLDSTAGVHDLTAVNHQWVGSLTGGPSLAGVPIPKVWGRFTEWEPEQVDETFGVWQVNDGSQESIDILEHRGLASFTLDGDVADLYSVSPADGHWYSCKAKGLFRLNATISGKLTVSGKGDNAGVGYAEDPAAIVKKIAKDEAGQLDGDLDLVAFSETSAAYPYPVWIGARRAAVKIWDLMVSVMRDNLDGWTTITRDGKVSVDVLDEPGTPTIILTEKDLVMSGVKRLARATKPKQTRLGYARYGVTQDRNELSSAITSGDTINDFSQEWRIYKTPIDADVIGVDSDAPVRERFTSLALAADAETEALREQAYWSRGPVTFQLPLAKGNFQYAIGHDVRVTASKPLEGLEAGFIGTIVKYIENEPAENILEVIGFPPPGYVVTDEFEATLLDGGDLTLLDEP